MASRSSGASHRLDNQTEAFVLPGSASCSEHKKELNILLLSETRVGKSTAIDGFANYMTYSSLEAAERHGMFPVPLMFELMIDDFTSRIITTRTSDHNDDDIVEETTTQSPKSYLFQTDDVVVRLIDTPGVGDRRGYDQDKKNVDNIMRHIAQLNELHGIVFLLKPNFEPNMAMIEFYIKELLTNLHKSASKNIVFCFPVDDDDDDVGPALQKVFNDNNIDITLCEETMYNMDNEAVRYLAAIESGVQFDVEERNLYLENWNQSVNETERLLKHIISRKPLSVQGMLAIAECRQMILNIDQPLSGIINVIAETVTIVEITEKTSQIGIPLVEAEKIPLDCTHEVCTSNKCMAYVREGKKTKTIYTCIQKYNPFVPRGSTCEKCGCECVNHTTITYEMTFTIETDTSRLGGSRVFRVLLQELESEQFEVVQKCAQFALFLGKNAWMSNNKIIDRYLNHFIENRDAPDEVASKNIKKVLEKYKQEFDILSKSINDPRSVIQPLEPNNVKQLVESLYSMKHVGPLLIKMIDYSKTDCDENEICNLIEEVNITQHLNVLQKTLREARGNLMQLKL